MNSNTVAPFTFKQYQETLMNYNDDPHGIRHLIDIWNEEQDKLSRELIKKILRQNYQLGLLKGFGKYKKALEAQQKMFADKNNKLYFYLTINPKGPYEYQQFQKFKKCVEKFTRRKCFTSHLYVFEQREKFSDWELEDDEYDFVEAAGCPNTDQQGLPMCDGFHCHMIFQRNLKYRPSKVEKWARDSFKLMCNTKNPKLCEYKWIPSEYLQDKVDYLINPKIDTNPDIQAEKRDKQKLDRQWRYWYGLHPAYVKGELIKFIQ